MGQGQEQGVGGKGLGSRGGQGGVLKLFTIAVGRDVGLWGWGNDGVGIVVGKGVGRGFY